MALYTHKSTIEKINKKIQKLEQDKKYYYEELKAKGKKMPEWNLPGVVMTDHERYEKIQYAWEKRELLTYMSRQFYEIDLERLSEARSRLERGETLEKQKTVEEINDQIRAQEAQKIWDRVNG